MTHDLADGSFTQDRCFDVCVAGAGAAGIVLALRLVRAGRTVALIESGGFAFEEATQDLYRSQVSGQKHTGIHEGRFRTWGGTTTRWGGQILELDAIDFAKRDWIPHSGWPIAKEDLEPYYKEALAMEGVADSILEDDGVWRAIRSPSAGTGPYLKPYFTRWCPNPNFAQLHGRELLASPLLTVLLHANLVELSLKENESVQAAECRSLNGNRARIEAEEFVLTTGAIETSRMLLNFAEQSGPVWNPNGLVGTCFQDHVDCEVGHVQPLQKARFRAAFTNILVHGHKYHPKFRLIAAKQEELRTLNVAGTVTFRDSSDEISTAVKATGKRLLRRAWHELDTAQIGRLVKYGPLLLRQTWSYFVEHRVYNSPASVLALRVHCEQQPDSESRITLAEERDRLGMRQVRLHWVISPLELRTIRCFTEVAGKSLGGAGIAKLVPYPELSDDDALRLRCDDGLHHIGGTIMSANPAEGVVDPDLRLHGVSNLSLCSASVFPTGGYSNPTHTVIALALRLAHRLTSNQAAQP